MGLKRKSLTSDCTFAVMETVNYFKRNDTNTFVLMLVASKAFDRVNYVKLFRRLVKRGICPTVLLYLLHVYTNQNMNVVWSNTMSDCLAAQKRVKQGAVLSPVAVYIDELLCKLKQSGYVCTIGHSYCGAFGYTGDTSLDSQTIYALQQMYMACVVNMLRILNGLTLLHFSLCVSTVMHPLV